MKSEYIHQHEKDHKSSNCTLYSDVDFRRYLAGAMSPRESELLEQHCTGDDGEHACIECASMLARIDRELAHEQISTNDDQALERVSARTKDLLKELLLP